MDKPLKISVFHNLQSGGAIRMLRDHILYLKSKNHIVDLFIPETANDEFTPLKNIVNNFYRFPVKQSFFRKMIVKLMSKLGFNYKIGNNSAVITPFSQLKNTQKLIANEINNEDYDIVFCEQDGMFSYTPVILKYLTKPSIYYCQQPLRNEKILDKLTLSADKSFINNLIEKFIQYYKKRYMSLDIEYAQYAKNILVNLK